jgi:hypothetical protein
MLNCYEEERSAQRFVPYLSHGTWRASKFGCGGTQPPLSAALAAGGMSVRESPDTVRPLAALDDFRNYLIHEAA